MRAICIVRVGGVDISANLMPILNSIRISDRAGTSSDSAAIDIDDTDGHVILPGKGDPVEIFLGWEGLGVGLVFSGTVDDIRASGGRSGRTVSISAKGMDTNGKAKEGQRKHFDNATIEHCLTEAGKHAGIKVKVDPAFAKIVRTYTALDDESFVAFGERMARQLGGTFKIVGDQAVLAKRNGGSSATGEPLSAVSAAWGVNLHSYDITPLLGRPCEKSTLARWYDPKAAEWKSETAETGTEGAVTTKPSRFTEPDQDRAKEQASSDAAEADRSSGEGTVTIEGNIAAQPEGICNVIGCRPGVDGPYRIDGVDHEYSRSGFITTLQLGQPKGSAGKDKRGKKGKASTDAAEQDFALPAPL